MLLLVFTQFYGRPIVLISEFKNALRTLGTRYPDAYSVFLKELEPSERNVSYLKIKGDPEVTPEVRAEAAIMESCYLPRDRNRPPSGRQRTAGTVTSQVESPRDQLISDLVDLLPQDEGQWVIIGEDGASHAWETGSQTEANGAWQTENQMEFSSEDDEVSACACHILIVITIATDSR